MGEFTTGPWRVKQNEEFPKVLNIQDPTYSPIANVASGFAWMSKKEGEANANLISAAPDMYKALSEILTLLAFVPLDKNVLTMITLCEQALAKAGGEQ